MATRRPALVSKPEGALRYEYDDGGRLARVSELPLPGAGEGGGEGVDYEYFYDAAGRLVEVNTPSGTTEYAYSPWGSRASMTLPNGVETTYAYDGLLRLETMEHRDAGHEGETRRRATMQ